VVGKTGEMSVSVYQLTREKRKNDNYISCIFPQMKPVETSIWLTVPMRLQFKDHLLVS